MAADLPSSRPGHIAAEAWYDRMQARRTAEIHRTGFGDAMVQSNILDMFKALAPEHQADFVDALGALIVETVAIGEMMPGRWNALESMQDAMVRHPDLRHATH